MPSALSMACRWGEGTSIWPPWRRYANASLTRCCRPTGMTNGRRSISRSRGRISKKRDRASCPFLLSGATKRRAGPGRGCSAAALLAKRLRGNAGLLPEKAGEVRGVREGEIVGDLVDRLIGEDQLAFRLGQHALADEVAGGDAGGTLDMIVQAIRRHGELAGVESKLALVTEVLLDQVAQRVDRRVRRHQRRRAGPGAARCEPRHRDGDEREITAHGEAVARTGEETLFMEISTQPADPIHLVLTRQGHHRIGGKRAQDRDRLA